MAVAGSHGGLTTGDMNYSKGLKAIDYYLSDVLTASFETHFLGGAQHIFTWLSASDQTWRKGFCNNERDAIESLTPFRDMDVTLQYKILTRWCDFRPANDPCWQEDVDSEEHTLYCIKEHRNAFAHKSKLIRKNVVSDADRNQMFDDLTAVCLKALDKLKVSRTGLGQPVKVIEDLKDKVEKGLAELKVQDIVVDLDETKRRLVVEGAKESEPRKRDLLEIQPFPQIMRFRPFALKDIYEPLDLYREERGLKPEDTRKVPLPVKEMFTMPVAGGRTKSPVICIEGLSGVGKSTFVAQVLSDHLDAIGTIDELEAFDLVLHLACKQTSCGTTLTEFVKSSLPNTSSNLSNDLLLRAIRNLKLLILADGFDETSPQVGSLLKELFQEAQNGNLRILMTSRTRGTNEAVSLMRGVKCLHVQLSSMSTPKTEAMARKYYRALRVRMSNPPPEEEVVKAVSSVSEHLEKTPRNIIMLTYLACVQPEKVKVPLTLPELLDALDQMHLSILMDRLADQDLNREEGRREIASFTRALNKAALQNILKGDADIDQDRLRQLADKYSYPNEMLDTFFSCRRYQKPSGDVLVYTFPHASQLEYRAALGIRDQLRALNSGKGEPSKIFREILQIDLKRRRKSKVWNLLLILVGILKQDGLLADYAENMAELIFKSSSTQDDELEAIAWSGTDASFAAAVTSMMPPSGWWVTRNFRLLRSLPHLPKILFLQPRHCCNEEPSLREAIQGLRRKRVRVWLTLHHCYEECPHGCCTWPLTEFASPGATCTFKSYDGPWSVDAVIPASTKEVLVRVRSPEGLAALKSQANDLQNLKRLEIELSATAGDMQLGFPLLNNVALHLILHDITDEKCDWVVKLLSTLHVEKKYRVLDFRYRSSLTPLGFEGLVKALREVEVQVEGHLMVQFSREEEERSGLTRRKLVEHAREHLGEKCNMSLIG
ncbi:uncharacterized protein LOC143020963 [Oratosquilla oratoria]|uniref:uncharacterized protein LOC143020963 n=1 Tax=Oratosquilla oratoria TaxID=337810 RepID=UPI003F75FE0C